MPYGLYDGSLKSIPGLGGVIQSQEENQATDARNLQSAAGVMQLLQQHKAMQDDQTARQVLASDLPPEQKVMGLIKLGKNGVELANHYMTINQAQQGLDMMKGLDLSGADAPAKLRAQALIQPAKAVAYIGMADHLEKTAAAKSEHQAQMGVETPIGPSPQMGYRDGVFADRSNIPEGGAMVPKGTPFPGSNRVTDVELPQAVFDRLKGGEFGRPTVMGVGPSSNPAENVQRTGSLYQSFADSPIEVIRREAGPNQAELNASDPLAISPKVYSDRRAQMATREGNFLDKRDARIDAEAHAPLEAVVRNGQPTLVPRSQAVGQTPYRAADTTLVPVKGADGRVTYAPRSEAVGQEVGSRVTDTNVAKSVQQLGRDLEKANLPQTIAVLEQAAKITPALAEYVTGPQSIIPDRMVPVEARDARQDIAKLFNITLKDRSGAAVTNQELERLKNEFGQGLIKTGAQLITAISRAKQIVNAHYQGIAASYGKPTLDAYNENLESIGGKRLNDATDGVYSDPEKERRYQEWKRNNGK